VCTCLLYEYYTGMFDSEEWRSEHTCACACICTGVLNFDEFCDLIGPQLSEKESMEEIDRGYNLLAGRANVCMRVHVYVRVHVYDLVVM